MSSRSSAAGRVAWLCLLACLCEISPAVAAPAAVPVGEVAALAGDRAVTVLGYAPHTVRVVSRGVGGGSARLATLSPPGRGRANFYITSVAASATTWAVAITAIHAFPDIEEKPDRDRGELIVSGSTAGGPPRTLASCARDEDIVNWDPIDLSVAGDDVAWSASSCPGADGVRLAPAGGGPVTLIAVEGVGVAITPAWLGFFGYEAGHSFIQVIDRLGRAAHRIPADGGISAFALGDAGVDAVIAADEQACEDDCMSIMRLAADGRIMRPGLAATPAGAAGPGYGTLVAGGGRVLAARAHGNGVVAVDLATGAVSYAGALGLDFGGTVPVAVDATNAVYTAPRCDGTNELHVEPTRPDVPARLSFVPCPVRVLARTMTLRRGRSVAHVPIRCPRGCDADWEVVHRGKIVGSFEARAPAGVRRTVDVDFDNLRALRRLRRATVMLRPDSYYPSHPRAAQPAPVRLLLRLPR
jgi:hypothetical protein